MSCPEHWQTCINVALWKKVIAPTLTFLIIPSYLGVIFSFRGFYQKGFKANQVKINRLSHSRRFVCLNRPFLSEPKCHLVFKLPFPKTLKVMGVYSPTSVAQTTMMTSQ